MGNNYLKEVQNKMNILESDIHFHFELIQSWAKMDVMQSLVINDNGSEINSFLENLQNSFEDFPFAYLICLNKEGKVVASTDSKLIDVDFSSSEMFKEVINGVPRVSKVGYVESMSRHSLAFSAPVRFGNQPLGVLFGLSKWAVFVDFLKHVESEERFYNKNKVVIANEQGVCLVFSDPELKLEKDVLEKLAATKWAQSGREGYLTEKLASQPNLFTVFTSSTRFGDLPNLNIGLVNIEDKDKLFRSNYLKSLIFGVILINILIVLFLVSTFLSRKVTSPIEKIALETKRIAEGGSAEAIIYESKDEIGGLVDSFNRMADSLKQSKQDLSENEKKYMSLVNNIPGAVYRFLNDSKRTCLFASDSIEEISGYGASDFVQNKVRDYASMIHPEDKEAVAKGVELGVKMHQPIVLDYRIINKDGRVRWIHEKGQAIYLDEKVAYIDGVILDVSESKEVEKELLQAQKMEEMGRLAGGIAHDFNNQLTAILGYSELLLETVEEPSLKQQLQEIIEAANRSSKITSQLLSFSRGESILPINVELNKTVLEADKMLRGLLANNIELILFPDESSGVVRIDPSQVERLLINLCVNASDAMAEGGKIIVETKNVEIDSEIVKGHPDMTAGEFVMLSVTDTGSGIPKEIQTKVFDPYFTTKEKGVGLGLSTCYGIVKQNGGFINFYSEVGKGTSFKVYFPRRVEKADEVVESKDQPDVFRGTEVVLLVEDDVSIRELSLSALKRLGYKVLTATNGDDALRLAKNEQKIDLLFTDMMMPIMDGAQLAQKIKTTFPNIRYLFTSGYSDKAFFEVAGMKNSSNFLSKPYSNKELSKRIREALDN